MQYIIIYLVFGGGKWVNEIKWMIGGDSKFTNGFLWYIRICGTVISPLLITVIVVAFLYDMIVSQKFIIKLTLTRPIDLPPHAPVAQKIADQR